MDNKSVNVKKRVVLYGNCHVTAVTKALEQYKPFCEIYSIVPLKPIQSIKDSQILYDERILSCDVFIHQSIQSGNRYGELYASKNIISRLKPSCLVISIPNLYHLPKCFFPQYYEAIEWKNASGSTVFFRDKLLDDEYSQKTGFKQILKIYQSDIYNHIQIQSSFSQFIEKVKEREKEWDIKVADFIVDNYRDNQLFYDPNHPTPFIIMYIVQELLRRLDVVIDDAMLDSIKPLKLYAFEMPLHCSVYNALGLRYEVKNIRYDSRNEYGNLPLDKYIQYYLMYEWQDINIEERLRIKSKWKYYFHQVLYTPKRIALFIVKIVNFCINRFSFA